MKGKVAGVTAAVLAVLLALGYFFLPLQEERRQEGNSGRKKLEIAAGESQSWPWSPALEGVTQADLALSGLKNAGGLSLTVEIRTPEGQVAASRKENPGELQEESIRLTGDFRKGVAYTVNVSAEGEGSVKVRGVYDENKVFQPSLTETGSVVKKNANLLYFAAGLVLLSLAPLFGTPGRRRPRRRAAWQDLLPWGTFALILGVGLLVSLKKPAFTGLGQEWMTWDEEDHFGMIQNISLLVPGGIRAWLHGIITWDPGYMPLALGWSLGEILGLEAADCYRTATVFSTVCYASMCALAVSHAPKYKAAFLVAGTMPTFLFMMTSMTYDTVVAGSILLGAALVLETAAEEQNPSPLRIMTMTALLALSRTTVPRATSRGPNAGAAPPSALSSGAIADSAAALSPCGFLSWWLPPPISEEGSGGSPSAGAAQGAISAAMTAYKSAFLIFLPPPRASQSRGSAAPSLPPLPPSA